MDDISFTIFLIVVAVSALLYFPPVLREKWKDGRLLSDFWEGAKTAAGVILIIVTMWIAIAYIPQTILWIYLLGFLLYVVIERIRNR